MKYFVEIGSNDYDTLLPLCNDGWTGVLVDPLPGIFDKLKVHDNCKFENVAITATPGQFDFHVVDSSDDWSSLLPTHAREIDPNACVRKIPVIGITFDELMSRVNFPYIDLLKIDAEGYDFNIIMSIDFIKHKVRIVQFEHHHMNTEQYDEVRKKLVDGGFAFSTRDDLNTVFTRQ